METKLIINADDFGLTESCSKAIAEAFAEGWITSTTACANGAYIEEALQLAKAGDFLDKIGIHINLTEGKSLTDAIAEDPFFCENGVFHGHIDRLKKPTKAQLAMIEEEVTAQVERLLALGYEISHADSHHHIHTCVYFEKTIKDVLFQYDINKIRLHRNIGKIPFYKRVVKNWYNNKLRKQGFTTCQYFGGGEDISYSHRKKTGVIEIMVHPDYSKDGTLIDRVLEEDGYKIGDPLGLVLDIFEEREKISYKDL